MFFYVYLQRSIDLNPAQKDLVLKVAELLVSIEGCDSKAEFWVKKAAKLHPGHPAVFNLKVILLFFSVFTKIPSLLLLNNCLNISINW